MQDSKANGVATTITNIKIEDGDKPTNWSPNPLDSELRDETVYCKAKRSYTYDQALDFAAHKSPVGWSIISDLELCNGGKFDDLTYVQDRPFDVQLTDKSGGTWMIHHLYKSRGTNGYINLLPIGYEYIPVPDAVEERLDAVEVRLDDLKVGGRNLLLNSNQEITNTGYPIIRYTPSTPMVAGETYTLTIEAKVGKDTPKIVPIVSDGWQPLSYNFIFEPGKRQKVSCTFTANYNNGRTPSDNPDFARVALFPMAKDGHDNVQNKQPNTIYSVKLESGSVATDYTEAPEDIELRNTVLYTTSKNKDTKENCQKFATDASVAWTFENGMNLVGNNQDKTLIYGRRMNLGITDEEEGTWSIDYLYQGDNKWKPIGYKYTPQASSQKEIDAAINNLKVGGVNLLTIGDHMNDDRAFGDGDATCITTGNMKTVKCTKAPTAYVFIHLANEMERWLQEEFSRQEGQYTLSFDFRHNADLPFRVRICDGNSLNGFATSATFSSKPNQWTRVIYTFIPQKANPSEQFINITYDPGKFPQVGYEVSVKNVQLERGNKATDYAESPVDLALKEKTFFAALKNGCTRSQASSWSTQAVREIPKSDYTVKGQCDTNLIPDRPGEFSVTDNENNVWIYSYLYAGYNKWNLVGYNMFPANTGPKGADGKSVPFTISNVKPPTTGTPNSLYFWTV